MQVQARRRVGCQALLPATSAARRTRRPLKPQRPCTPAAPFQPPLLQRYAPSLDGAFKAAGSAAAAAAAPGTAAAPVFQDGWPLWCLLAACGAVAQVCESRTRWGAALSGPLISMLCAVALAAAGVIPVDCTAYDTVWRYLMPMAAACYLLETDVRRLLRDGGPVLAGFAVGAVGMVAGAVAAWWLLREPLGPAGAKLACCLCASYVGGSVNFAAVALALQVSPASIPGAMAADNLLMAVFLAALMAVPVPALVSEPAATAVGKPEGGAMTTGKEEAEEKEKAGNDSAGALVVQGAAAAPPPPLVTAESLSLTVAAAAAACAAAQHLAEALNAVPLKMLILAVVAAALAAAAQGLRGVWARGGGGVGGGGGGGQAAAVPDGPVFAGAAQVGSCLMMLFFAVIGASAGSPGCLAGCGVLVPFLGLMVALHWAVVAALGRGLLRLPAEALLLGSNANIGGPATAAAMAAAKGWRHLVQPAMLTGSLGYATGTAAGLAVARLIGAA